MLHGAWLSTILKKRHSCESLLLFIHLGTHKDPVGTALPIQEANMDDTTQTKTHSECAAAGYMTTEKRSKRQRDQWCAQNIVPRAINVTHVIGSPSLAARHHLIHGPGVADNWFNLYSGVPKTRPNVDRKVPEFVKMPGYRE
ncbi:hypothetical protein TNCV_3326541 [Trichonephila clavipes]|nr:hypothetical protein TNCV_3326541 [Trichonephila clavipes]